MYTDELDVFESPTWLDSPDFKAYRTEIERVVYAAARAANGSFGGVTTRYIHKELGGRMRRRWTQDALDGSRHLEAVGLMPTRYRPIRGVPGRNPTCSEGVPGRNPTCREGVLDQKGVKL